MRFPALTLVVVVALMGCGGGGASIRAASAHRAADSSGRIVAGIEFVRSPTKVLSECRRTADLVRYAVPCPMMLPLGIAPTPGVGGCGFTFMSADRKRGCGAVEWQGWIFGSVQLTGSNAGAAGFQHLALQGAPRVVRDPARAIDGPAMFPGSRVRALGNLRVANQMMRWYYVTPSANVGSAFMHHLVLVWTRSGHTFAYGFHVVDTLAHARALDLELVRHLMYVRPQR